MPKLNVSLFYGRPLLDIASYARRGPARRDRLSLAEVAQVARTVRCSPEVVVKVLTRDSNDLASVGRHVNYIGRKGDLELETDDGERLGGKGIGRELLDDWDLDLDEHRRQGDLVATLGRKPPKFVHKLMFSMPPGTPANAVLTATRNFLREEFALKHRYAFVLHTDEPHPHVHAIVKAVSEQGMRLNIRKATLREWRATFARQLREQGIPANATECAVRGVTRVRKTDGVYRASLRGESTHMRQRVELASTELVRGRIHMEGKAGIVATRERVKKGWEAVRLLLLRQGDIEIASRVSRFVGEMMPPSTEAELLARELLEHARLQRDSRPAPDFRRR